MKNFLFMLFCFVYCAPIFARNEGVLKNVRVEIVHSFSAKELWNSSRSVVVNSGDASMIYQAMDLEAAPFKSGWYACALVMVGNGDLGVTPVSFKIWTRQRCALEISAAPNPDKNISNFLVKIDNENSVRVQVDAKLIVSVNDKRLAQIVLPH